MADKELIERNKNTMKGFFSKSAFDGTLDSRSRGLRTVDLTNEAENFELSTDGLLAPTKYMTNIDEKYAEGFRHSLSDENESSQRAYNRAVQESFAIVNGDIEKKRENDYKNAMREGGTKGSFNPETFQKAIDSASNSLSSQKDKLKNMLNFLEASIDDSPDRKALIDQINSMLSSTTPSAQSPDNDINERIARLEEINLKMFETLQVMSSYNAIMAERLTNGLSAQTRAISEVANLTLENKNESMSIKSILKEMRDMMKRQQRMENVRQQNIENMDTNISFLKAIEAAKYLVDPNVRTAAGGRQYGFSDTNANIKRFKEDY